MQFCIDHYAGRGRHPGAHRSVGTTGFLIPRCARQITSLRFSVSFVHSVLKRGSSLRHIPSHSSTCRIRDRENIQSEQAPAHRRSQRQAAWTEDRSGSLAGIAHTCPDTLT
jgi:hypothetical protein